MTRSDVLFVNHTSTVSGAELILLDTVEAFPGAAAFLFEAGPLETAMRERGLAVTVSKRGTDLSGLRRDANLLKAVPLAGRLAMLLTELTTHTRRHGVIYANSQKAFVLSALATAASRRPLIWHLHDIVSAEHFGGAQRKLQITLANNRASRVVVPSRAAADAFIGSGGRRDLVTVVPNGLDIQPDARTREHLREELDLPRGPLIGVFSRLAAWKGQHIVLQALARLPEINCIIAGDALFGETAYAESLRSLAKEAGIEDRVRFLGQRRDVPTLMRAVDVVVHPSVDPEPFGRTLVEAMLASTPVIATNAGAASEILEGGRAGTLVEPGNAGALARAVHTVFGNKAETRTKVELALARARELYNVTAMRRRIVDLVASVGAEAAA